MWICGHLWSHNTWRQSASPGHNDSTPRTEKYPMTTVTQMSTLINSMAPATTYDALQFMNVSSADGLLHEDTKPLPKPVLTYCYWCPSDIHLRAMSQEKYQ